MTETFSPLLVYSRDPALRVMVAPPRYIQGPGALASCADIAKMLGYSVVGLLASKRGLGSQGAEVSKSLSGQGISTIDVEFGGECSIEEIEQAAANLRDANIECLVALGGGKCVDAGKCVAHRLDVPVIVVSTLASNDAPCSALSVVYSPQGVVAGVEFFPANPLAVIVDTEVVAAASERYLVSGMGDAMATWYEARVCANNPKARTLLGARPTLAACALGELCAHTLYDQGVLAAQSVRDGQVDDALEQVVEANTLLSGVGFESGGLAGAHAYAQGYTAIAQVEYRHLHGEMVAMGTVAELVLEQDAREAERVARFFAAVGLPIHLGQMGLSPTDDASLDAIVEGAMMFEPLANQPFEVTAEIVKGGLLGAHEIGLRVSKEIGEEAYLRCMSNA